MLAKFLLRYHWVWKMGAMFLLLLVGMTLPMLLPVFLLDANGPISEWVEIPAPEGTQLQCWERRGKVMCHERPDTNRGEVLMGNGKGGVR